MGPSCTTWGHYALTVHRSKELEGVASPAVGSAFSAGLATIVQVLRPCQRGKN